MTSWISFESWLDHVRAPLSSHEATNEPKYNVCLALCVVFSSTSNAFFGLCFLLQSGLACLS